MAELIFDAIKAGLDGLPWMHNRGNLIAAKEILTESEVLLHEAHSVCRCFLKKIRPFPYRKFWVTFALDEKANLHVFPSKNGELSQTNLKE